MIEKLSRIPLAKFPNYIESIRFPHYKGIEKGERLDFEYPFTVIVGPNGCGKTSILHALYGCPLGNSTTDFWFSTEVDPIKHNLEYGPPRFIYRYKPEGIHRSVEAIKTWRKKANKPDYWEPARPRKSDGMENLPEKLSIEEQKHASTDRWKQVPKDVIYVTFKAELSAFDKFMNFGSFNPGKRIRTKQDLIRSRTKYLQKALQVEDLRDADWRSRRCSKKYPISPRTIKVCSGILEKDYRSAIFLEHNYFDNQGVSISFQEGKNSYSEALAGSGEVAIFCLVERIINAKPASLILLDEPEVSLHPGAQRKLRDFIFKEIAKHKHQVVITSHSPTLIEGLPPEAIKLINKDPATGNFNIINRSTEEQAFSRLGSLNHNKTIIIVEDDLAKALVEKAIKQLDDQLLQSVEVTPYPGGGDTIKQHFINILALDNINHIKVFLDGDKKAHAEVIQESDIPKSQDNKLSEVLNQYVGMELKLALNGGNGNHKNSQDKIIATRKAFDIYNKYFFFGNTLTPEGLLYEIFKDRDEFKKHSQQKDLKKLFEQLALDAFEESTSQSIMFEQKRWIRQIPENNPIWMGFVAIVAQITGVQTEAEAAA